MQVSRIPFPSPKTWTIIYNLWNFFLFFKKVDYHMQFSEYLSRLQKHGLSYAILGILSLLQKCELSYAIYGISIPFPKMWTIICNLWNFFLFLKNVDYHMLCLEFLSLQKRGLSYAISGISIPSPKTWTIICNFWNFIPISINVDYHM